MILDLRYRSKLDPRLMASYNRVAADICESFNNLIDAYSKQHAKSIDWWVSSPASRNTLASPLFHYCCSIALIQELLQKEEAISEIVTDSKPFKKILERAFSHHGVDLKVTFVRPHMKQFLRKIIWPFYSFLATPFKQLLLFFGAKRTRPLQKDLLNAPLTLLDTFVNPGHIERDRYYPGVIDSLSGLEKESVCFVPLIYGFPPSQYLTLTKRLRSSERNFILKEDYLKLVDYLYAWGHFFRIRALRIGPRLFREIDISPLVQEEISSGREFDSSYAALLNYRFAMRLRNSGVRLRAVIDWFENQIIDRGWNAGFRRFFPKTPIKGYQGFFASPYYLCMYPTTFEYESKVIPNQIWVIGPGLVEPVKKFCPNLDVKVAPALRFKKVWEERRFFPEKNKFTILVALPMMKHEAMHIMTLLRHVRGKIGKNVRFWIKPHPTMQGPDLQAQLSENWEGELEILDEMFNDCVEKSDLLISNASSTCVETLAKGIPVIIVGNRSGLTDNPIPENVNKDFWSVCFSQDEIIRAVQSFQARAGEKGTDKEIYGTEVRKEFFEPVAYENVRDFLELN